jgi:hypothetical protein
LILSDPLSVCDTWEIVRLMEGSMVALGSTRTR